jgi:hypothetical protein
MVGAKYTDALEQSSSLKHGPCSPHPVGRSNTLPLLKIWFCDPSIRGMDSNGAVTPVGVKILLARNSEVQSLL